MCLFPHSTHTLTARYTHTYYHVADALMDDTGTTVNVNFTIVAHDKHRYQYVLKTDNYEETIVTTTQLAAAVKKLMYPYEHFGMFDDATQRQLQNHSAWTIVRDVFRRKKLSRKWFELYRRIRQQRTKTAITEYIVQRVDMLPKDIMRLICTKLEPKDICMLLQAVCD